MVTDLLKFTIREESLPEAIEHIREQAIIIREEDGCVMTKVFQSKIKPTELFMLVGWQNRKSLERLQVTEFHRRFREDMTNMMALPLEIFDWETVI